MATQQTAIAWTNDFDRALDEAAKRQRHVLLDFTAAPMWAGCARLEAEVYPDPRVVRLVEENFVPVRAHVKEQREAYERLSKKYNGIWTPTVLVIDQKGEERYRIEGFLPADHFVAQLTLGLGHSAMKNGDFAAGERWFRQVGDQYPKSDAAPEALYWAGVARYKASGDAGALGETARQFETRYPDTTWATRASVWSRPK